MESAISDLGILIVTAAIVAMVAQRVRIPYAVGLLVSGVALAVFGIGPVLPLTKDLVYTVLLPPLVFQAALHIEWSELRRDLGVIATLATLGVVISAVVVAAGMHYVVGWPAAESMLFGSLIAATDPVSVIATLTAAGARGRLKLLVEAESLLNDSTAAILFGLALGFIEGRTRTPVGIAGSLLLNLGGGVAVGAAVAGAAVLLARRTADPLVELTFTTIAAYGSFLLAERVHASGVLASLTAGLVVANIGLRGFVSPGGRAAVFTFWEYAAFIVNSIVFILIGARMAQQSFAAMLLPSGAAIVLVLLGRAASIYPTSALFAKSRWRLSAAQQHVLFWGGLRGALALALALGLPSSLPGRDAVVSVTFAVAAFSIVVQGLTMKPLLARMGEVA